MAKAVGVLNGNWRGRAYLRFSQQELTSSRDDVLSELKERMDPEEFERFFDLVYTKYRWSDTERYERILRYKLTMIKRNRGGRS